MSTSPPPATSKQWLSKKASEFLEGSNTLSSPDVTKVQALAIAQAFIAVLVVLGLEPDDDVKEAIIALSVVLGAVLPLSDAAVRRHRVEHADKLAKARQTLGAGTADATVRELRARARLAEAELRLAEARASAGADQPGGGA